jgi:hypothetical protein
VITFIMEKMDNEHLKNLCLALMRADSENEVITLLEEAGYWDKSYVWRYYGDKENNSGIIRGQQSKADAAIVEKIVNSVDACLMNNYQMEIKDNGKVHSPKSIQEAVARYFDTERGNSTFAGRIKEWSSQKRTEVARSITLAATGSSGRMGTPCFTIADIGEGQTPDMIPRTFVSLSESNKIDILFVQGQFNMGGAGVLRFCGTQKLQLIVSRRNPQLIDGSNAMDDNWGFTVVRREPPMEGRKVAVYTFLAPIRAENSHFRGSVLNFKSESMPILPEGREAYKRDVQWGSLVKLYEYAVHGYKGHMFLKGGLLSRLDLRLPDLALPVRLYECRKGYKGHAGSFETTLTGIGVRLDDDKGQNIEEGFPTSSTMSVMGQDMVVTVYAFKKKQSESYRRNEGIIFSVNGQTQGQITTDFFRREKVRHSRLRDSIFVIVDCTKFDEVGREELFMSSRDRLSDNPIRKEIEKALMFFLRDHEGLKSLNERRKREDIESKLKEDKPLEHVLNSIIKHSPSLASIFSIGKRLSTPFKTKSVINKEKKYNGKPHPTYFKFKGKDYGQTIQKGCHINLRSRITFETDVVNDYFSRSIDRGEFELFIITGNEKSKATDYVGPNLNNGVATLNIQLPKSANIGDTIFFEAVVIDPIAFEPFINRFSVNILKEADHRGKPGNRRKPPSGKKGKDRESPLGINMPDHQWIKEEEWEAQTPPFNKYTALRVITDYDKDEKNYVFYLNADNLYLKTELKGTDTDPRLIRARFMYGMMLLGLSLLYDHEESKKIRKSDEIESEDDNGFNIEDRIAEFTKASAPVLLPMISSLGDLEDNQLYMDAFSGEED